MSEKKNEDQYIADAKEMIGKGYKPVIQFEPPTKQIVETDDGYDVARSLGWIKFSVHFREDMLKKLKGGKLSVFISILLHLNERYESFPSFEKIAEETGLHRDTVMKTVKELEEIPGLMDIVRRSGKSNVYRPSFAARGKANEPRVPVGKTSTGQPVEETSTGGGLIGLPPEETSTTPPEETSTLRRVEKNKKTLSPDPRWPFEFKGDYTMYPQDVWDVIVEFSLLWNFVPPQITRPGKYGSRALYWIEGARSLLDACGEFGVSALVDYHENVWVPYMTDNGGLSPFDIDSPKSLVNKITGHAARMRQNNGNVHSNVEIDEDGFAEEDISL